jgi:hypothetical protein
MAQLEKPPLIFDPAFENPFGERAYTPGLLC